MGMILRVAFFVGLCALPWALLAEEPAPALPFASGNEAVPDSVSAGAEVATPFETPEPKDDSRVIHKKPSRARWGNFALGALGGAIFGGGGAALYFATDSKGHYDQQRALNMGLLGAGLGAACGGVLAFLLGFTDPLPLTPPDMTWQGSLWLAEGAGATLQLRF